MSLFEKVYRYFFPVITHEWYATRAVGNSVWLPKLAKCANGVPCGAGWFITFVGPFPCEESCRLACED